MQEISLQEQYLNNVPSVSNKYKNDAKVCHTLKLNHEMSKNLHIKNSDIHGKGLFAKYNIKKDCVIQPTHVKNKKYGVINLVPNSDYNHSKDNENCKIITDNNIKYLVATKDINEGQEIFVDYTKDFDLEQPGTAWSN
tara:strand:+ start:132 stop:545 length:414 start_codon:yes stop_codon:yes gene_type:complete